MKTFLLIAILSVSGQNHEYIIDHDLSYEDCKAAEEAGIRFDGPPLRRLMDAELECREETKP
jgi:hypothetical protein